MKSGKNNIATVAKTVLPVLLVAFQSCSTYNSQTSAIESDLLNGNFKNAIANIDNNKFLKKDRNRLLYLMEKGKMEHLNGNYTASNALFEQAYIMIDDRIKSNAGQVIASKFTNPMAEPYKGEDFEKVTIHYYMALNYFHLGQPDEALVEAKRINIKLYQLNEKYKQNKNKYSEDAFSQILQGILYEATGDINNAFIAYRNAEQIYVNNGGNFFGVPMPEQLKQDLIRTAWQMNFIPEYSDYLKKYGPQQAAGKDKQPATVATQYPKITDEAIIFWENGLSPAKDQILLTVAGGGGIFYGAYVEDGQVFDIILPIPTGVDLGNISTIAIPKYRKRISFYSKATIIVNGQEQPLQLAQDFYPIAKQCLKDRMLRETIDIVVRFAAKKAASAGLGELAKGAFGKDAGNITKALGDIAGAATEKADTRNWQSLPATISYTRVPVKEGENKFIIKKYGPNGIVDTDTITIPYKRGLQVVNYFDLGRTQVLPVNTAVQPSAAPSALAAKSSTPVETANGFTAIPAKKVSATPQMTADIANKYNQWVDAGNGISYSVTYAKTNWNGQELYAKKVFFLNKGTQDKNIAYTITEKPFTKDNTEVSTGDYYELRMKDNVTKQYLKLTETLQPGGETAGYEVYQKSPDFYVTILDVK